MSATGRELEPLLRPRLRRATAALHADLEARLDLLAPDLTLERFVLVARGLHAYHAALEPRLAALNEGRAIGFPLRARAPLLRRDLLALGVPADDLEPVDLPALTCPEDLAGCVYVLEGAALGGRVVTSVVAPRLGLTPERGGAFFSSAGQDPAPRWAAVLAWLEALARRADADRIVAAAVDTFRTLRGWLEACGALR